MSEKKTIVVDGKRGRLASARCQFQYRSAWVWLINNRLDVATHIRKLALRKWPLGKRRNKFSYRINAGGPIV
jgi:hypothetical protein